MVARSKMYVDSELIEMYVKGLELKNKSNKWDSDCKMGLLTVPIMYHKDSVFYQMC